MTYIIVGKKKETQSEELSLLLEKLFGQKIVSSPDMHVLDPSDKNSIGVEEVKAFQKKMIFKPFQEKVQVGIILESEKLTHQAQNSLLKTLEESPMYSAYILCVTNEKNLLPTILSRGQIVYAKTSNPSTTIKKDTREKYLDENFLILSILERFQIIEESSKDKASSLNFLNDLEEIYKSRLELDIKNGKIESSKKNISALKMIEDSRSKIIANCNKKLVLESLIVNLEA